MRISRPIFDRFWEKVNKKSNNECWEWIAHTQLGYGRFRQNNTMVQAHRFSWKFYYGPIPGELHVLHKCNNRKCVNPKHLFLGTDKDNALDKVSKNRQQKLVGVTNGRAKLTEKDILNIRKLYTQGIKNQQELENMYNVINAHISRIIRRVVWKHL